MKLGYSGTQRGMTRPQRLAVWVELNTEPLTPQDEYHHGICVGGDAQYHDLVRQLRPDAIIVGHPPIITTKMADLDCDILWEAKPYLDRNFDIAAETDRLIAAPFAMMEEQRSGTWSTVRRARALVRPIAICWPDGSVTYENWPNRRAA